MRTRESSISWWIEVACGGSGLESFDDCVVSHQGIQYLEAGDRNSRGDVGMQWNEDYSEMMLSR